MHLASCFVCPSIFEPWGLVVNEALSASLPVIATKEVGATFDLIKDKQTGFVADDMKDFGSKMLKLFNDSDLLGQYSKNASDLMQSYWNYLKFIIPIKIQIDNIEFLEEKPQDKDFESLVIQMD